MKLERENLTIERIDWPYVLSQDINKTFDEVKTFFEKNKHPFIKDKHQLAYYVGGVSFKELFNALRNTDQYYQEMRVKRKNGKKRTVYKVKWPLNQYQHFIKRYILNEYEISKYATAYFEGASIKRDAEIHCGKKYILKMDLADFFGHITLDMIKTNVFNKNHFPPYICYALLKLCTYKGSIVQGAATSPAISNIVMKHFDDVMGSWCDENNISFSRYSDDIAFSSDKPLYPAYCKAKSLLEKMGFEINEAKTKFVTNGNRQLINGVVVNEGPRVAREYRRKLRQEVYYALKYLPEVCQIHRNEGDMVVVDQQEFFFCNKQNITYIESLFGKISWVLQINPNDKYFKDAKKKLQEKYFKPSI